MALADSGYAIPITLNRVYNWIFPSKFSKLNGILKVVDVTTFADALTDNISFVNSLYIPAGLTQADYVADVSNYQNSIVYALQSPTDDTSAIIYVPYDLLEVNPDPGVAAYPMVYLQVPIGYFTDSSDYSYIKGEIDDVACSVTGYPNASQFFSKKSAIKWMTDAEYAAVVSARNANITTLTPLTTAIQNNLTAYDELKARYDACVAILLANNLIPSS